MWKHTTIPNAANVFTIEGHAPQGECVLDPGANFVMIGKRVADALGLQAKDLDEGITYTVASGAFAECRGVTKKTLAICLLLGTPDQVTSHLHVQVDNATSYDVLIGAHFVNRVTVLINYRNSY